MKRLFNRYLLTLTGAALLSAHAMAAEPASCKTVRMGVVSWTDVVATSGMADVLLNGLGYDTRTGVASAAASRSASKRTMASLTPPGG